MTIDEVVYVFICARLDADGGPVIDLFQSDPWEGENGDGTIVGRDIEGWWESLTFDHTDPSAPVDITAADNLLRACGYQRLNNWTPRTGRSGHTVHTADALLRIEDIR
ncbi:hypothetical protein [Nocardia bovistercoris]|uniref:Uncharacterized protein n=1 Tax=Nocardia bovistercoris TaxID=2785916 RepID=A0A931IFH7_9NOCA|nr:hypothetical protein [Nocardia bovistercoris]MBH0780341.1 hypothetical protein [Nocardia bovistercoris]